MILDGNLLQQHVQQLSVDIAVDDFFNDFLPFQSVVWINFSCIGDRYFV